MHYLLIRTTTWMDLRVIITFSKKMAASEGNMLYGSIYRTFSEGQSHRDEEQICWCPGQGVCVWGGGGGHSDRPVRYLDCVSSLNLHINPPAQTHTRTHITHTHN